MNTEIVPEADHCSDTECFDAAGAVVVERPENVVGSYAAYYKDGASGDFSGAGGLNFATGKANVTPRFSQYLDELAKALNETKDSWKSVTVTTAPGEWIERAP